MGIIRFILTFLVLYFVFRWIGRHFLGVGKEGAKGPLLRGGEPMDKIVPCPACGVYNPTQIAYRVGNAYFCSQECFRKKSKY